MSNITSLEVKEEIKSIFSSGDCFGISWDGHRRNTFCDVTAPGQRYLSLFDRMKDRFLRCVSACTCL